MIVSHKKSLMALACLMHLISLSFGESTGLERLKTRLIEVDKVIVTINNYVVDKTDEFKAAGLVDLDQTTSWSV